MSGRSPDGDPAARGGDPRAAAPGHPLAGPWAAWLEREAADPRTVLAELRLTEGRVEGVAEARLEAPLRAFAGRHGLELDVAFPPARAAVVAVGRAPLRVRPEPGAPWGSEALAGEALLAYDERDGHVRVATARDDYLGWMAREHLRTAAAAHDLRFAGLRGHVYAAPTVASERIAELALGCLLADADGAAVGAGVAPPEGGDPAGVWRRVALAGGQEGYVRRRLLTAADAPPPEPEAASVTALALRYLGAPYVWGGVTAWGLDCSGLTQACFAAHGVRLPRDADLQRAAGHEVALDALRAGDLLLFPGHVALALDAERFVHANAHAMAVSVDAIGADAYADGLLASLTAVVRPSGLRG